MTKYFVEYVATIIICWSYYLNLHLQLLNTYIRIVPPDHYSFNLIFFFWGGLFSCVFRRRKSYSNYFLISQAVTDLNEQQIYIAPNNGNGYSQTNRFFSVLNSSMSF